MVVVVVAGTSPRVRSTPNQGWGQGVQNGGVPWACPQKLSQPHIRPKSTPVGVPWACPPKHVPDHADWKPSGIIFSGLLPCTLGRMPQFQRFWNASLQHDAQVLQNTTDLTRTYFSITSCRLDLGGSSVVKYNGFERGRLFQAPPADPLRKAQILQHTMG